MKNARTVATLTAVGALLAVPTTGLAAPSGPGTANSCAKVRTVDYRISGTLVSVTADNPATPANEATVTLTVKSANSHARKSGEIADQDAGRKGVQVAGATYTVPASDAFTLKLNGYQGADTPSVGDRVHVRGRIPLTKKRCAPAGTSLADRYGAPDVRKVTISDRDPDA